MLDLIEPQCLNYILIKHNLSFITSNDLNETYFPTYKEEYKFIKNHFEKYGNTPDKETLIQYFPDFPFVEVNESEKYLVERIQEAHIYTEIAPTINKVVELMTINKTLEAVPYLKEIQNKLNIKSTVQPVDLIKEAHIRQEEYEKKCDNIAHAYVSTGFKELDEIIGGWDRQEEFAIVCAKTNVGKSWFLVYFALVAAIKGLKVGVYSGEMTPTKLGYRLDTFLFNISNWGMTHGDLNIRDSYKESISKIEEQVKNSILVITPDMIGGYATVSKLKEFIESNNLDMLCIDQISLMEDERKTNQTYESYSNIAKDLKQLQVLTRIPIIAVAQLNREQRDSGLSIDNIAGSYDLSRYPTVMLLLEQKDKDNQKVKRLVINVGKARDSEKGGKLTYLWDINYGKFTFVPTENDMTDGSHIEELKKEYGEMGDNIF